MKKIKLLVACSIVLGICACEPNRKSTITETGSEVVKVRTPASDTDVVEPQNETRTVEGKVESINNGKDGYTAKVITSEDESYSVTISRADLKDPQQYKSVNVGDMLSVTGDYWKMEEEHQITVRVIN